MMMFHGSKYASGYTGMSGADRRGSRVTVAMSAEQKGRRSRVDWLMPMGVRVGQYLSAGKQRAMTMRLEDRWSSGHVPLRSHRLPRRERLASMQMEGLGKLAGRAVEKKEGG
jgi:hypothetical protein